ncbi:class II aldolase/adducin family protein [Clostridium ganghwense]|uniref:Class II aldolase/adducin family protein n=1 Tax=Clostridium ganghwense TaxID=312089 RepID=A0ABT4CQR0_9CLOT|nr:class II aldolase/adducin family protein [Clostridium ganghwense]MCY6370783.1 class II aldolase/adducin family protein [Clostridium ganghwense]
MNNYMEEKRMVIEAGKTMLNSGLTVGTWGNLSVRTADGKYIVITPSGVDYEKITPEMMSLVDMDGKLVSGKKPSIEAGLHLGIYKKREDVNAVIHTHSIYTCAVAATRTDVPAVLDEMAQIVGGGIKTAKYGLPGSQELASNCAEALGDRMAVLLANHGGVCVGKDLKDAFKITNVVEVSLKSYCLAKSIGNPVALDDKDVNFMRDFFLNSYGK